MFISRVLLKLQILVLALSCLVHARKFQEIKTKYGRIRGIVKRNVLDDSQYYAFFSIPYAKKLTYLKKFRDSEPVEPWNGEMIDATIFERYSSCIEITTTFVRGDLNCLTMDIYVPRNYNGEKMATMIYIHGESGNIGVPNGMVFRPDYLLKQGVIVVMFHYRLDIYGFFNAGTIDAPGNMGLKDQYQAIKFYREVIAEAVGGDLEKITLFGSSFGSACVSFHMMSPMSRGLFQRAIMSYGTSTDFWAFNSDFDEMIEQVATHFKLKINDPGEIAKELSEWLTREVTYEYMRQVNLFYNQKNSFSTYVPIARFTPSLEKKVNGCEQFLPGHVHDLMVAGDFARIPVMIGVNALGVAIPADFFYTIKRSRGWTSKVNAGRVTMDFLQFTNLPPGVDENFRDIEYFLFDLVEYYTGKPDLNPNSRQFIAMISTFMYTFHYWIWINTYRHFNQDVYAYSYAFDQACNLHQPGCYNFDDLPYIFYNNETNKIYKEGSGDWYLMNLMTKSFTNFAKYANPTPADSGLPKWEKYNENREVFVILKHNSFMQPADKPDWTSDLCWLKEQMNDKLQDHIDKFKLC